MEIYDIALIVICPFSVSLRLTFIYLYTYTPMFKCVRNIIDTLLFYNSIPPATATIPFLSKPVIYITQLAESIPQGW